MLTGAIETLGVREREVQDGQGRWHLLRIRPYQTRENQIDGAVMMAVDIDTLKRAHEYAEAIVATVRAPLLVLDADLRVRTANRAFYDTLRSPPPKSKAGHSLSWAMVSGTSPRCAGSSRKSCPKITPSPTSKWRTVSSGSVGGRCGSMPGA